MKSVRPIPSNSRRACLAKRPGRRPNDLEEWTRALCVKALEKIAEATPRSITLTPDTPDLAKWRGNMRKSTARMQNTVCAIIMDRSVVRGCSISPS
eukprot:scaffold41507_cov29-Tisochrysis_lutea.AAC.1